MRHTFARLYCHLVFSTKNRHNLITPELRERLYPYLGGIIRNHDGQLIAAGGTADHIHLLIELPATMSVAEAVRIIKANSSKWIHETFPLQASFA